MLAATLLAVLLIPTAQGASIFDSASRGKCQPIDIPICKDIPYNYTYYPSSLQQLDAHGAQAQTDHFKPLIKTKCNPHIQFFICSVFAPMCPQDMPQEVTSCRAVCEQVKRDCINILVEFGLEWPELLECDRFPEEPKLCMKQPEHEVRHHQSSQSHGYSLPRSGSCPQDLLDIDPADPRGTCATKCGHDLMFSSSDKTTARFWLILWGAMDLTVSLITLGTFLIDRKRFRFPQRCAFYMAFCGAMYSLPHLFPLFMGYEAMACDHLPNGQAYMVYSGFENTNCLFSFVLTYYFGTAIFFWWFMFAFAWYLSAGCKWVPEGVAAYGGFLHCASWGGSAILTIAVLVMHRVDANELTGLCGVGNNDAQTQLLFNLAPKAVLLVMGVAFMLIGVSSMCRERENFKNRGTDTSKLERLLAKTITFFVIFLVSMVATVICDTHHYLIVRKWQPVTTECKAFYGGERCIRPPLPQVELYLLGVIMSLAAGIAPAVWILSSKSFASWTRFICCGLCGSAPQKTPSTASRPLLEPPSAPPPQPPSSHYLPMSTHSQNAWRPSKVL